MKKLHDQIVDYVEVKALLDKYKKAEKEQRVKLLDRVFPSAGHGILNEEKGEWSVKGTFGLNYKLDLAMYEEQMNELTPEEHDCIILKPTLHAPSYKALYANLRPTLDEMVTISPALPTISLKHFGE